MSVTEWCTDDHCNVKELFSLTPFSYLVQNALLPVLPVERPLRTVAVEVPGGVAVAQHIVAHHGEEGGRRGPVERGQLDPGARRGVTRRHYGGHTQWSQMWSDKGPTLLVQ